MGTAKVAFLPDGANSMVAPNKASKPPFQQHLPTAAGQLPLERLGLSVTSDAVPEPLFTFAELARRLATSTGRRPFLHSVFQRPLRNCAVLR